MILTALVVAQLNKPKLTIVPIKPIQILEHRALTHDLGRYKYQAKYNPDFGTKTLRTTQNTSGVQFTVSPQ